MCSHKDLGCTIMFNTPAPSLSILEASWLLELLDHLAKTVQAISLVDNVSPWLTYYEDIHLVCLYVASFYPSKHITQEKFEPPSINMPNFSFRWESYSSVSLLQDKHTCPSLSSLFHFSHQFAPSNQLVNEINDTTILKSMEQAQLFFLEKVSREITFSGGTIAWIKPKAIVNHLSLNLSRLSHLQTCKSQYTYKLSRHSRF